jgi:hypothetical protein
MELLGASINFYPKLASKYFAIIAEKVAPKLRLSPNKIEAKTPILGLLGLTRRSKRGKMQASEKGLSPKGFSSFGV